MWLRLPGQGSIRPWSSRPLAFSGMVLGAVRVDLPPFSLPTYTRIPLGCQLFVEKMLEPDVTVGMSLSGALTLAGLGCSSIVPLIKAEFVDWIVSTGAILYHDLHFALNYPVRSGN